MAKIQDIIAKEIMDSKGKTTLEVTLITDDGNVAIRDNAFLNKDID